MASKNEVKEGGGRDDVKKKGFNALVSRVDYPRRALENLEKGLF